MVGAVYVHVGSELAVSALHIEAQSPLPPSAAGRPHELFSAYVTGAAAAGAVSDGVGEGERLGEREREGDFDGERDGEPGCGEALGELDALALGVAERDGVAEAVPDTLSAGASGDTDAEAADDAVLVALADDEDSALGELEALLDGETDGDGEAVPLTVVEAASAADEGDGVLVALPDDEGSTLGDAAPLAAGEDDALAVAVADSLGLEKVCVPAPLMAMSDRR
jgi:hypothetical protein